MKLTFEVEISEESIQELADAIASKLPAGGAAAAPAEEEDFLPAAKKEEELTEEAFMDKMSEELTRLSKEKVIATVKKIAGVTKAKEIPADKRKDILAALAKQKK